MKLNLTSNRITQLKREQWTVIFLALGMIVTGLMLPQYPVDRSIPGRIVDTVGGPQFYIYCLLLVVCGLSLLWRPKFIFVWILPILLYIAAAFSISFTAGMYYMQWILIPVGAVYHQDIPYARDFKVQQLLGISHLIMGIGLLNNPDGSGMGLFYSAIDGLLLGIDPASFYQAFYLVTGVALMSPIGYNKYITQLLTAPFIMHGMVFVYVIHTVTQMYSVAIPMLSVTLILFTLGAYDESER